jgi:hypothetical protein
MDTKLNDEMNIQMAFDLLDISLDNIEITNITTEYIKKKYHRMALLHHPDKNGNSIESNNKFKKINEAYKYLSIEFSNISPEFVSSTNYNEPNVYVSILTSFINSIVKGSYNEIFMNIIKDIVVGCNKVSVQMFEKLDKEMSIEVYNLLYKYRQVLYITNETLELVSSIISEKYKNDRVYILNPSLTDLMDNNIYKLYIDDELYIVPLWHNELYFDSKIGEIIVLCNPILSPELTIDENNNIYIDKKISLNSDLLDNEFVSLNIGGKVLTIVLNELLLKRNQIYRISGEGISKIVEKDIYNVSGKSDIIVNVILE